MYKCIPILFFLAIQGIFSLHVDDLSITSGESSEHLKHTGTTSCKILNHKRTFSRKGDVIHSKLTQSYSSFFFLYTIGVFVIETATSNLNIKTIVLKA